MISIILPSYNRPEMFRKCVNSLRTTASHLPVELVCVIDGIWDFNYLRELINEKPNDWSLILSVSLERRGAIKCWNRGLKLSTKDLIMPIGDDQYFYPNWLDIAIEAHKNKLGGYGLLAVNDLNLDGNKQLGTTLIYDRKFCQEVLGGVAAYPVYHYYYIDSELNERAKAVNKYYWCKESIVEHLHPSNGKRDLDSIDTERTVDNWQEKDRLIFEDRKARGFPNDFERVI